MIEKDFSFMHIEFANGRLEKYKLETEEKNKFINTLLKAHHESCGLVRFYALPVYVFNSDRSYTTYIDITKIITFS